MEHVVLTCTPGDAARGIAGFVAGQLQRASLITHIDARDLVNPGRFWPNTKALLANPGRAGAWLLLLPDQVLQDPVAVDVLALAFAGARGTRGNAFPVLALRPGSSQAQLPGDLTALQPADLADPAWPEIVRAAIERRRPDRTGSAADLGPQAYALGLHMAAGPHGEAAAETILEIRPGQATWAPFFAAVPAVEAASVRPRLGYGVRSAIPIDGSTNTSGWSMDGEWLTATSPEPATRRMSYYLSCGVLPTVVRFGVAGGHLQYTVRLRPVVE